MSKAPLISVVMATYNAEFWIAEAIQSVLSQSLGDFEFFIVNDGSNDSTGAIIRDFAARDNRVVYLEQNKGGVMRACNYAIPKCRGKYLARMDSDDICMPQRFEKQVQHLESHPDCVLVGARVMVMDPYGSPVAETGQKLDHESISAQLMTGDGGWALVNPVTMMPLQVVRELGMYREKCHYVCEDHDLFLRLSEVGKVANLPDILLWYRRHYKSFNHTRYNEQVKLKREIIADAYARRGVPMPPDWEWAGWHPTPLKEQVRVWGWAAIKAGNFGIARRHALSAVSRAPFSMENWRLLACAIRGKD